MEEPNEEEKIGDAINGGKPLEDIGNGEVIGTVVGDTRGEAEKLVFENRDHPNTYTNHRKSLIQHCERSELRLHFEQTKVY